MNQINPLNIANLLLDEIKRKYAKSTPVTEKEIEIKNHLLGKYYYKHIIINIKLIKNKQ
jgi:hypothetical protein